MGLKQGNETSHNHCFVPGGFLGSISVPCTQYCLLSKGINEYKHVLTKATTHKATHISNSHLVLTSPLQLKVYLHLHAYQPTSPNKKKENCMKKNRKAMNFHHVPDFPNNPAIWKPVHSPQSTERPCKMLIGETAGSI